MQTVKDFIKILVVFFSNSISEGLRSRPKNRNKANAVNITADIR